jgi:hypothetical protein
MTSGERHGDLSSRLAAIRSHLCRHAGMPVGPTTPEVLMTGGDLGGLSHIVNRFALSPFESDVLVFAACSELDLDVPGICAAAHRDPAQPWPTFGLAMAALPGAHWDALSPERPLRSAGLVETDERCPVLTAARLSVGERVLFALLGLDVLDPRLIENATPLVVGTITLPASHQALVHDTCSWWLPEGQPPLAIRGECRAERNAVAMALTQRLGAPRLWQVMVAPLVSSGGLTADLLRLLARESVLTCAPVEIELDDVDPHQLPSIRDWIRRLIGSGAKVLVNSRSSVSGLPPTFVPIDLPKVNLAENVQLWRSALGPLAADLNGQLDQIAGQFRFTATEVDSIAAHALFEDAAKSAENVEPVHLADRLWNICRERAQADLDGLAERIVPAAEWSDLVLPPNELASLTDLIRHARHRAKVYEDWCIAGPSQRGSGVTALLSGPSGTGKSLAAEVVAGRLGVDLYRIDLSSVVSKYIGETEKNLRRVFDTAERSGAVLLIDEADALFGKRSEVRDSHDRYANIEVSYLLQLMESYRGLAILTSNLRANIDGAFVRRLDFIITFPFPDAQMRKELWCRVFTDRVPCGELDPSRLAQLQLSGGSIRNVAVHAAFVAADRGGRVTMSDVLQGARSEYAKLDRPLTQTELDGWPQ